MGGKIMKRVLFLTTLFMGLAGITNASFAKCKVMSCGDKDLINGWITADVGGSQCWFCGPGPNSCGNNDVVPYLDGVGDIVGLYKCNNTWKQAFENYEPGKFCDNSELKSGGGIGGVDLTNAKKTFSLDGKKTTGFSLGDFNVFTGQAACIYVKCNPGYMPSADKTKCIEDNRENACTSTGGTWNGTTCTCRSSKNIRAKSDNMSCECISSDYEPDGANGCKKKQSVIDNENRQNQERQNQQRKTACEQSGGTWHNNQCKCDSAKNLVLVSGKCECPDTTNYKRVGNRCELTDAAALQRECESDASRASGAYWDASVRQCLCTNPQHVWMNKTCQMNPRIEECNKIYGAAWNNSTKECYCTDPDKEMNAAGTACVETDDAREKRENASAELKLSNARRKAESAAKKINAMKDGFEKTVWKTSEGNFNGSRLLSDSVAGVVLGTAGGLITSNVIKKNQVENGFEDIQCTVGGQVVAGWGDQFRVGIH